MSLDPWPFLAVAAIAAAVFLSGALLGRRYQLKIAPAAAVLATGLAFYIGCRIIGLKPHWPPAEPFDRLMFILFPAVLAVELAAALAGRFAWIAWIPRIAICCLAGRIILHNTYFIKDSGPDTPKWTSTQTWEIFAALASALVIVWAAMAALERYRAPRTAAFGVAIVCGGAAAIVMLSGYATDPQFGLVLCAALMGIVASSLVLAPAPDLTGAVSFGVVGIFALMVLGPTFGTLSTPAAAIMLLAPVLCWLPELPPRLRAAGQIAAVAVPVLIVVLLVKQKFDDDSVKKAPTTTQGSASDGYDASDYDMFK